ncbi:MAG TPA: tripartite tricarboxylate transporter substrate binding protein [Xanthobacteraceae bacterium]|nr:tripartite tricarboxylate transporter substrate binding protein [Xanthobacteraceae bacterium]
MWRRRGERSQSRRIAGALLSISLALAAPPLAAETYPERPIRLIIPFAAGGPNDVIARPLADHMAQALGQPVVIDNRPGANGILGTAVVAKSAPDGYTLLMTTGSFTANPAVNAKTSYDALADFIPVTLLAQSFGIALMVRPDFPAKSLVDLVDMAKRAPGTLSYAHSGVGNANYVTAELFQKLAGIELIKVPYKGSSSFAPDIMSGQVTMGFLSAVIATPNVKSGLLRALATTGSERAPSLPDTPTFQELGFKEMDVTGYFGLWFPTGTPPERVRLIQREAAKALQAPTLQKIIADSGLKAIGSTPEEFARFVARDFEWQKGMVKRIGLQPE